LVTTPEKSHDQKSPKDSNFSSEMEIPEKQRLTQKTKPEVKSQTNPSQCLEKRKKTHLEESQL